MMLMVTEATHITFYPKDNNIGISCNMLFRIRELSEIHGYTMHMDYDCTYYTWTSDRVSPDSEVRQMVEGIRDICKGIAIVFEVTNTVRSEKQQTVKIDI